MENKRWVHDTSTAPPMKNEAETDTNAGGRRWQTKNKIKEKVQVAVKPHERTLSYLWERKGFSEGI